MSDPSNGITFRTIQEAMPEYTSARTCWTAC